MVDVKLGDVVRLRKKHACGDDEWQVIGLGVDVRIKCLRCQRQVLLERDIFKRRVKALVSKSEPET